MSVFINSIGNISPQPTVDNNRFLEEIVLHESKHLSCIEPNYRDYIPANYLRRMSRVIKMGVSAAKICLEEAKVTNPDAIIVGTGLGCLEDTEKFLTAIYEHDEGEVSPTQFIQSTHNSVASQIAIMLGCSNYNFTYVHRGFSFESALSDALLQFAEEDTPKNILIGGIDEITESYLTITTRLRQRKPSEFKEMSLIAKHLNGSTLGEGATFFILGNQSSPHTYAEVVDLRMYYKPRDEVHVAALINRFLSDHQMQLADVDLVLLGINGDPEIDQSYHHLRTTLFSHNHLGYYKHLCGEYKTASAFAMWLAAQILHKQQVPEAIVLGKAPTGKINNILIYNNYSNINHSLLLLRHV